MDFILTIIKPLGQIVKQGFTLGLILFSSITISTIVIAETSTEYSYQQIANIELNEKAHQQWLQLIANPGDRQQFYLANKQAQLFLVDDGEIIVEPLLDLNQLATKSTQKLQLTAFVLHPDFAFRDQPGFATFYTAHIGKINPKSSTKLLKSNDNTIDYQYQTVITEWQFNQVNLSRVEHSSRREILRIALVDQTNGINQLSFNPYKKSWNDDYALLYFSLPAAPKSLQIPLHSGAIFRINPERFGRKNYTVPNNNPYIDNSDIADEIILLGTENIKQFVWPEKNNDQLLVAHQYNNEHLLTLSQDSNDWRNSQPEKLLSHRISTSKLILYKGRALGELHQRLLYINKTNTNEISDGWQLNSIKLLDEGHIEQLVEQKFSTELWSSNDNIELFVNSTDELILLDQNNAKIYRLTQENNGVSTKADAKPEESSFSFILTLLILVCCVALFFIIRSKNSQKYISSLTRRNFAYLEVSQSKQQVGLYRRHQHTTDTVLNITDIITSEITLNNSVICLINNNNRHGFNEALERDLRHYFSNEYQDKMVDEKIRTIRLILTDANQNYPITLYARKGNKRLTKNSYKEVIEELIDWCWLIAKTINTENTGHRKILPNTVSNRKSQPDKNQQQSQKTTIKHDVIDDKSALKINSEPNTDNTEVEVSSGNTEDSNHEQLVDTELVNSLEKLVKFKQQGFLTEAEFTKAKELLLAKLME